jgi:hypothetical protein
VVYLGTVVAIVTLMRLVTSRKPIRRAIPT